MQTALTTNVSVSDVIVYNSVVENVIKSGLSSISDISSISSTNAGSGTNSSGGSSSSSTTSTLTAADKNNIQNLYESYVDSIGQMSMKAISKGQVTTSTSISTSILIIPLPSLSPIE